MKLSSGGVNWLLQAGKLMQAKTYKPGRNKFQRKIVRADHETYPEAVLRELNGMPADLQEELCDAVDWSLEYALFDT